MPAYVYVAMEPGGRRLRGVEEAPTGAEAATALEARGLFVIGVEGAPPPAGHRRLHAGPVLLDITRALASLLSAGLPLERALRLTTDLVGARAGRVLEAVRDEVERGGALHAALGSHPGLFSPFYRGVVHAGERSGSLSEAFHHLEAHLERSHALRSRLLSSALYPLILAAVGGTSVVLLMVFVVPRFALLLEDAGAAVPASTAFLLAFSGFASAHWRVLLALAAALTLAAAWSLSTAGGRTTAARLLLALPGLGQWRREALAARFARLTSVLLTGGAPVVGALDDVGASIGDPVAAEEVAGVRLRVREGWALHRALGQTRLFSGVLSRFAALGEESGRLAEFLGKGAEVLEARVQRGLERVASLAEPAMILAFGAVVAFVALALLQAIYGVNAGTLR